jgi:DNA-binding Lrp family transcriptional regulator
LAAARQSDEASEDLTIRKRDDRDEKLLDLLRANARMPAAALARQLGISRPAVHERLRKLEESGAIRGYTIVGPRTARAALRAQVLIEVDPKLHDRAIAVLRGFAAVRRLHTVSGDFDLLLELRTATAEELDEALTKIGHVAGVKSTTTSVILSTRLDRGG